MLFDTLNDALNNNKFCDAVDQLNLDSAYGMLHASAMKELRRVLLIEGIESLQFMTTIPEDLYSSDATLTTITIPSTIKIIEDYGFWRCDGLTSINISDSVTSIGNYAFYGCSSLESITVAESNNAFKSIDGNLYTKDGTTLIQYAIGKTENEFVVPDSVTSIGNYAFSSCSSLASIIIPNSVTSIGECAFQSCSSLESVTIGNSVASIGKGAFQFCSSLESVTIGNSVTSIGNYAFEDCSSLKSITIPDSVTSIGDWAFWGCDRLTSVTIGNHVTAFGRAMFGREVPIKEIHYNGTKQQAMRVFGKGKRWIGNCNLSKIICTDGVIDLTQQ